MSRKSNCYDHAPVESFFASLKRELIHRQTFATREEARSAVFEWIAVWYNRKRRPSTLGYLSPEQYEQQHSSREPVRRAA
jgi:putative transposase